MELATELLGSSEGSIWRHHLSGTVNSRLPWAAWHDGSSGWPLAGLSTGNPVVVDVAVAVPMDAASRRVSA